MNTPNLHKNPTSCRAATTTKRPGSSRPPITQRPRSASIAAGGLWHGGWMIFLLTLLCSLNLVAQPAPGDTNSSPVLDSWSFSDTNQWKSDLGYYPILSTNLIVTNNGPGNSLLMDTTNVSELAFNTWNSDGTTNLNLTSDGSLMFWFNPDWTSASAGGSGPGGNWSALIDLGIFTTNASFGSWSCGFDSTGNNFYFITQDANGHESDYIYAPVTLTAGTWNLIALTWCSTNTALYFNGACVTNGPGISVLPSLEVMSNGFAIGSDAATGLLQMHGSMNGLVTYNCQLDAGPVDAEWTLNGIFYFGGGAMPLLVQAPSEPQSAPVFDAITGPGYLIPVSTNTSCTYGSNEYDVWFGTNGTYAPQATQGTNGVNLTFTISGGASGVPYDVFATPALTQPLTNGLWTWIGQGYACTTYTIPGLTNGAVFLLLGTPLDSDADGLTDAYERLVSHTNPYVADTSGDGMLDGWKALWGMSGIINNPAQPSERATYTYDGTGRLEMNSGVSYTGFSPEVFGFDNEGNITSDQQ